MGLIEEVNGLHVNIRGVRIHSFANIFRRSGDTFRVFAKVFIVCQHNLFARSSDEVTRCNRWDACHRGPLVQILDKC